ncbi:S8 family serine peptidase [Sphingobium sp. Sx8-8]|uniref:S8 family peptidase n=1 Tax=Sphingobium sp. Sx8-8 TaxID=2933617 RepID=UPI001F55C5E7|nr:S8 family serine peptidase [Sphingobium sp. Sx8-8]
MIRLLRMMLGIALLAAMPPAARAAQPGDDDRILVMVRVPAPHFRADGTYGSGYSDRIGASEAAREARRIARTYRLTLVTDWAMPLIRLHCFVMRLPAGAGAQDISDAISKDSAVEWAQPMHEYQTLGTAPAGVDPLYAAQPARTLWHLDALHRLATGRGVTVAVIDSGIDPHHPDLAGQVSTNVNFVAGSPFAAEWHGTAVGGIIAAKSGNGIGIVGVAPGARLMGLRACSQAAGGTATAICDSFSLAKALHYAIEHDSRIVNMSLGGPSDRLLAALLDAGMTRGATFIAAYAPDLPNGGFPASHPGVIAVAGSAISGSQQKLYVAPARDIPATRPGGGWGLVDGTSYAAAHVSGLLALMAERQGRTRRLELIRSGTGAGIDTLASVQGRGAECRERCPDHLLTANRN